MNNNTWIIIEEVTINSKHIMTTYWGDRRPPVVKQIMTTYWGDRRPPVVKQIMTTYWGDRRPPVVA